MKSNKSIAQHTSLHQCGKIRHRYRLIPPYRAVISISNRNRTTVNYNFRPYNVSLLQKLPHFLRIYL